MGYTSLGILMYRKCKVVLMSWPIRKLGLLIMPVLKFGGISHMIPNQTFGLWAVFYIKCAHTDLLSVEKTFNLYIKMCRKGCTSHYQYAILNN